MRRVRALALSLLVLAGAAAWFYVRPQTGHAPGAYSASPSRATGQDGPRTSDGSSAAAAAEESAGAARSAHAPQTFNQRVRCAQTRMFFKHLAPPDELALLCDRKPLKVLQTEAPLAQAGDPHAITLVALLARDGRCEALTPSPTFASYRARMVASAQKNGATAQTVQRLDDLLSEEERGPSSEELEACRQSVEMLRKLRPGMMQQLATMLGGSPQAPRGEKEELDLDIEVARKTLVRGDAEGEENLAGFLLQKGTPDSQAEALTLLEEAADSSPSAKTALARCLLEGCPTPTPDRGRARKLLVDAATAGDYLALTTLAGPADPNFDRYPDLPAAERYAWGQFLDRLREEGCFGAADYATWATAPSRRPDLRALSPADAATAQAQTAELLAKSLGDTRTQLGCD
jgi:hypothetical protein